MPSIPSSKCADVHSVHEDFLSLLRTSFLLTSKTDDSSGSLHGKGEISAEQKKGGKLRLKLIICNKFIKKVKSP